MLSAATGYCILEECTGIIDFNGTITGVNPSSRPPPPRWYYRALAQGPRVQVQLREADLSQVLRKYNERRSMRFALWSSHPSSGD